MPALLPDKIAIWNRAQVTSNGAFAEIPIETYHGDQKICPGPSISSSGLRTIFSESPAAFWATSPLNPHREMPKVDTGYFSLGRAAHTLLLGEEGFASHYAIRPERWDSWRTNAAKEWRDDMLAAGKTVLEPKDIESIRGMAGLLPWQKNTPESGLRNSHYVQQGILAGEVETSLIWQDPETGVWLKARPDVIPTHSGMVADFKTCSGNPARAVEEYGYHQQGALIGDGLRETLGIEMTVFVLVFVQPTRPFTVTVHEIVPYTDEGGVTRDPIEAGARANRFALRTFARCLATNTWPANDGESRPARLSRFYFDRLDRRIADAELEAA